MMKTTIKVIFATVCFAFFSCQRDVNLSVSNSSITNEGVLSGKIINFTPNSIDTVKAWENYFVGTGKVTSAGDFSIKLSVPILFKVGTLSGVTLSDSTAKLGIVSIYSFLNLFTNGVLSKCNYTVDSLNKAGISSSIFLYSDKTLTIKGTHKETVSSVSNTQTANYTVIYDVMIKKGWNELVEKVISNIQTTNSKTLSESLTNVITDDLQWHYFKIVYTNVNKKLTGESQQETEKRLLIR
jgi:hypothetical protein